MTRQQAYEFVFGACKQWNGDDCDMFISGLKALGLIKFDESEDEKLMNLANKYSEDIIMFDSLNPLNTVTDMAHVISFLLKKVENK